VTKWSILKSATAVAEMYKGTIWIIIYLIQMGLQRVIQELVAQA
jgi:hypothetical protein